MPIGHPKRPQRPAKGKKIKPEDQYIDPKSLALPDEAIGDRVPDPPNHPATRPELREWWSKLYERERAGVTELNARLGAYPLIRDDGKDWEEEEN